jgi:hypothetical protein
VLWRVRSIEGLERMRGVVEGLCRGWGALTGGAAFAGGARSLEGLREGGIGHGRKILSKC